MMKIPTRFWISIMIFFTTFVNYMLRVNLSISIIAMAEPMGGKEITPECLKDGALFKKGEGEHGPRYAWSQNIQGHILGAFFYGLIISSLLAGPVAEQLGPWKATLIVSTTQGVLNSLIPVAASLHYSAVFVIRFLIGLTGGIAYPSMQLLIAKWAPPAEKGKFTSMLLGNTIGIVVTWPLVGFVTDSLNWPWGFYATTLLTFTYCIAFFIIVSDSPDTHWFVSQEEKEFIEASQRGAVSKKKALPPYKEILTSRAFWAMTIGEFGNLWGLFLLITGAPKFLVEVMGFNIRQSGFLSALPYLGRFIGGLFFGWVSDLLRARTTLKTMTIRRIATVFSHYLPGLGLISIITAGCNATVVVALMIASLTINGALIMGHMQTPQDIAPNFAATLYGWMMFFSGTTGFIVPAITGALIEHHNGLAEWHIIFTIGGCAYIVGGSWYILTGSASLQSWNYIKEDDEEEEEKAV